MYEFIGWLLISSLKGSVLIAIVLAAHFSLSRWIPRRWLACLWLLVAIRLVMPFEIHSGLSIFNLGNLWKKEIPQQVQLSSPAETKTVAAGIMSVQRDEVKPISPPLRKIHVSPWNVVSLIWLAGAAALTFLIAWRNLRLSRSIRGRRLVTDSRLLSLLEDCRAEMKVHAPVALLESPEAKGPVLVGFVRPMIVLPAGMTAALDEHSLRFIFLHELAHHKFMDVPINWIMTAVQVLHWFNPLVWYALAVSRNDREEACDEHVLVRVGTARRRDYGAMIVRMMDFNEAGQSALPCLVGILEDKKQIERRIRMIAKFKEGNWRKGVAALALTALLAAIGLTAAEEQKTSPAKLTSAKAEKPEDNAKRDFKAECEKAIEEGKFHWGIISEWTYSDPKSASEWAMKFPNERKKILKSNILLAVATAWGKKDPKAAVEWAKNLPGDELGIVSVIGGAVAEFASSDLDAAREWVLKLPDGRKKDYALRGLADSWASRDPNAAAAWVIKLPKGNGKNMALQRVAFRRVQVDLKSATDWAKNLPEGDEKNQALAGIAIGWSLEDPKSAAEFATAIPDKENHLSGPKGTALTHTVIHWRKKDPDGVKKWVEDANLDENLKEQLQKMVK